MPGAVALRVKLLRGSEGAELDDGGNITAVSGRAATEKLLEVGDCILDHTALHPSSKCEVTLLRYDEDLATAVQGHGQGNYNDHIPCYRMIKVPLRSVVEGYEIVVNGLRVKELQGQLLADALLRLDDLIVAVDGARVDSAGLLAALRRKADSMQIFTVLRRCSDYDVRTEVQNKKGSCIPETVEDVQSASVVDAQEVLALRGAENVRACTHDDDVRACMPLCGRGRCERGDGGSRNVGKPGGTIEVRMTSTAYDAACLPRPRALGHSCSRLEHR